MFLIEFPHNNISTYLLKIQFHILGVAGQGSKQMNKIIVNGGSVYVFLSNSDGSVKKWV